MDRQSSVQAGLQALVDQHRKRAEADLIVQAYKRLPQTKAELANIDVNTRALVEEEPWPQDSELSGT